MRKRASNVTTNPSGFRTLMEENIFISKDPMNRVRMLVDVLPLSVAADKVMASSNQLQPFLIVGFSTHCACTVRTYYYLSSGVLH
jgi:hypothetical protein